jgi:hypothetical protein
MIAGVLFAALTLIFRAYDRGVATVGDAASRSKTESIKANNAYSRHQITPLEVALISAIVSMGLFNLFMAMDVLSRRHDAWYRGHPTAPWYAWFEFWKRSGLGRAHLDCFLQHFVKFL